MFIIFYDNSQEVGSFETLELAEKELERLLKQYEEETGEDASMWFTLMEQ
jgi:hypothetical protein